MFLADGQIKSGHLARKIFRVNFPDEIPRGSVNADCKNHTAGSNGLGHDDCPEITIVIQWDNACERGFTLRSDYTCGQVNGGLAYGVGDEYFLGCSCIFRRIIPSFTLSETNPDRRQDMFEFEHDLGICRSDSRCLCPKEVRCLVMGHQTVLSTFGLVLLNLVSV